MISLTYRGDHPEYGHAVTIEYADKQMTIPESVLESLAHASRIDRDDLDYLAGAIARAVSAGSRDLADGCGRCSA